jgi:hypothetical protein
MPIINGGPGGKTGDEDSLKQSIDSLGRLATMATATVGAPAQQGVPVMCGHRRLSAMTGTPAVRGR